MFVLLLFLGFLTLSIFLLQNKRKGRKYFPGPIDFPLVGSALQFFSVAARTNMYNTIKIMCNKYADGKICGFFVGSNYWVFVEDPILGKDILNCDDLIAKFPLTSITYKLYGPDNIGISQAYGHNCKEMRKFSSRNLKRIGFGKKSSMETILKEAMGEYLVNFEEKRVEGGGLVNMEESFYYSTLDILWTLMTGLKFNPENDKQLLRLIGMAREILKDDSIGSSIGHAFPFLRYIPKITKFQYALDFWTEIRAFLQEILEHRRAEESWKDNPSNFMDFFLCEIENGNDPLYTDAQCVQTCMDLFLAGLDSTAGTLDWIIIYLITYPRVYLKVQEEIDTVIGRSRLPNLEDRLKMPYTEAVMLEVMRIANVIIYTMRAPLKDVEFKEFFIPRNTHIVIKLDCFHKDKQIWGDPENFRPERFLDSDNKIINAEKIFTFGYGKRMCIGEASSKQTIFIFLTTLLQKYSLEMSPIHPPSLRKLRGILISHTEPFSILANPRE